MIRKILIFPTLMLMSIGFVIGLVIGPIWFGVLAASDLVDEFIDKARHNTKTEG